MTYRVGADDHTLMMRTPDATTEATAVVELNAFMAALAPILWLTTSISLERSAKGSNKRFSAVPSGLTTSWGTGTPNGQQSVFGLAFPGRSVGGSKTRVYVIPVKLQGDDNYLYTTAENTAIAAAVAVMNSGGADAWIGVDGTASGWYNYATSKQNDHYVKKRRGA
jgi:hypothetical protein